ncbi:MAG: lysophospholipid acyltransferase family protein [Candidatus Phytoplasma stylosanthis]|uniref:lysophospholipid acyltransferase family protein n=2 Tax=Candidatus Phytoplasma stylosanthis TaxID=2798314 RepID=UPI00293A6110|nr:lysophospholipid acyltransferase family protein [Candidatus Phytoplasma stylosanthis]MDV3170710.1 lysophospholipid acyltransferase family protein [Candidatus Phytoplasma stylosanthis]MDV3173967.1 lysophospholipid acyltransferase family protein [Candidatus Phytoplasma stylosanthis]MDV3202659.1 lysophospholipid acyltransferase family protein [Candidatus Phytoplasma stylosanthis]
MKFLVFILFLFINIFFSWILVLFFFFWIMFFFRNLEVVHPLRLFIISSMSRLIIIFFRIKIIIHNKELIPIHNNLVIYSNHKTNFDPFIIASFFPRNISFTPKNELYFGKMGWFLSPLFHFSKCILIQRNNNRETIKNILKGIENIKKKLAVVVFYEGGIKNINSDKIINSLDGSFKIALKSHSDILPISLKGIVNIRGKCWFRKKKIEVFIHESLTFEKIKNNSTREINLQVTNVINSVL